MLVAAVASIASLDTDTPTYDVVATVDVPPFVLDEGALEQTFELHAVATSYAGTIGMQVAIAATWDGLPSAPGAAEARVSEATARF